MTTDAIRSAADDLDERGIAPDQYLLITWDANGAIRHHFSKRVGADLIAHLADYRQALMRLNGAPGALQ
jgi:hypothetical protein